MCNEPIKTPVLGASQENKGRVSGRGGRTPLKLLKVVFVHAHAVKLEGEAAAELRRRIGIHLDNTVSHPCELRGDKVYVFYISLIEGKVHLNLLLREACEGGEGKGSGLVLHIFILYWWGNYNIWTY